jgi:hypothetical protein
VDGWTKFRVRADEAATESWQELIAPGVLRKEKNGITLFVALEEKGRVVLSEISVIYTSNRRAVTRQIMLNPG